MLKKENIQIKKIENLDDTVEVKTVYNNKEFKMLYSYINIESNKEIDRIIEDFIKTVLEYKIILNKVIKNKKPIQEEEEIRKNHFIDMIFAQGGVTEQEKELLDIYYLNREKIKNINYNITNNKIRVSTPTTIYIDVRPYKKINKKELLEKRLEIIRVARSQGISISYKNKTKNTINKNWNKYVEDIRLSEEIYQELKERWEHIRDNRGLHVGIRHDTYYNDTFQLQHTYEELGLGIINTIQDVANYINNLYNNVVININNRNYTKIFL